MARMSNITISRKVWIFFGSTILLAVIGYVLVIQDLVPRESPNAVPQASDSHKGDSVAAGPTALKDSLSRDAEPTTYPNEEGTASPLLTASPEEIERQIEALTTDFKEKAGVAKLRRDTIKGESERLILQWEKSGDPRPYRTQIAVERQKIIDAENEYERARLALEAEFYEARDKLRTRLEMARQTQTSP